MDKYDIKYNDLNNEDYEQYNNKIKNKLSQLTIKKDNIKKSKIENDNLFINQKFGSLISDDLIEDSSEESSSISSTNEIKNYLNN